jgi:hypothetical protein
MFKLKCQSKRYVTTKCYCARHRSVIFCHQIYILNYKCYWVYLYGVQPIFHFNGRLELYAGKQQDELYHVLTLPVQTTIFSSAMCCAFFVFQIDYTSNTEHFWIHFPNKIKSWITLVIHFFTSKNLLH